MFRSILLFCFIGFWSVTAVAALPTSCDDGQVSSAATDGHCCWPGQGWSDELERCTGAPQCPSGWTAQGSFCVRGEVIRETEKSRATPAPTTVERSPTPTPPVAVEAAKPVIAPKSAEPTAQAPARTSTVVITQTAQPRSPPPVVSLLYTGGPIPPGATLEHRTRGDVLQAGFATFAFGYVGSFLMTMYHAGASPSLSRVVIPEQCHPSTSQAFIPVVGPILIAASYGRNGCTNVSGTYTSRLALNVVGSAVQLTGIVMFIAAFAQSEEYVVFRSKGPNEAAWQVTPGTEATPGGITASRSF